MGGATVENNEKDKVGSTLPHLAKAVVHLWVFNMYLLMPAGQKQLLVIRWQAHQARCWLGASSYRPSAKAKLTGQTVPFMLVVPAVQVPGVFAAPPPSLSKSLCLPLGLLSAFMQHHCNCSWHTHLDPVDPNDPVLLVLPCDSGAQAVRVLQELVCRGVGAVMNLQDGRSRWGW